MKKGRLILIVGASGSGKTALSNEIIRKGAILNDQKTIPRDCISGDDDYYDQLAKVGTNCMNTFFQIVTESNTYRESMRGEERMP